MTIRQANLAVLLDNTLVAGAVSADVEANAYLSANRFSLSLAYGGSPSVLPQALPLQVEIRIGLDDQWRSLLIGNADRMELDPIRCEFTIDGRDLTSLLIAAQTAETFENQTASEIATLLASRHGLTPMVADTEVLSGRYYQNGRTRSAFSQHATATSEWDVLIGLAEQTGYDVWIDNASLYFQPMQTGQVQTIIGVDDCVSLCASRALDLAVGPTIVIKSWDCLQNNAISASAGGGATTSAPLTYTMLRPNLSFSEANGSAERVLSQLRTHEFQIECDMPGDLTLMPRDLVSFQGIGCGFDGAYRIMEVNRRISAAHGFIQSVTAKGLPWTAS